MKKFTFKGVLDGFRSSVQAAPRGNEQEIQETLRPDHFQIKKIFAVNCFAISLKGMKDLVRYGSDRLILKLSEVSSNIYPLNYISKPILDIL
ncbi:unnamed protein product, partial [Brenthis ino]